MKALKTTTAAATTTTTTTTRRRTGSSSMDFEAHFDEAWPRSFHSLKVDENII